MLPSLTHVALHVRDLEACLAFYRDYCGLGTVHERDGRDGARTVWLAEAGMEQRFVLVFIPGGPGRDQAPTDYSHLGFAVESRAAVDALAERAQAEGRLAWPPRQDAYPVGYYCGVRDPDGRVVEFSYGQPLGPGSEAT
ncbi:MAG: VOC family protein [Planctomycetota bacterium]